MIIYLERTDEFCEEVLVLKNGKISNRDSAPAVYRKKEKGE